MKRSRRRFLRLIAAGSAAAVAAPVAAAAQAATRPVKKGRKLAPGAASSEPRPSGPPPALAEEIRRQKGEAEKALKAVRDCPLPPGSEPAFVFLPIKARKKERPS